MASGTKSSSYQLENITLLKDDAGTFDRAELISDVTKDKHGHSCFVLVRGRKVHFSVHVTGAESDFSGNMLQLDCEGDAVCWARHARFCVVGDSSGTLNFVLSNGQKLFSHQITQGQPEGRAFYAVAFGWDEADSKGRSSEDLFALSTDGKLFRFVDLDTRAIGKAADAQDQAELQSIKERICVSITNIDFSNTAAPRITMQVHKGFSQSSVFIANGGITVWQTPKVQGSKPLVCVDDLSPELIGGNVCSFKLVSKGRWLILIDDTNSISWWDSSCLLKLGSWTWQTSLKIQSFAILPNSGQSDSSSTQGISLACLTFDTTSGTENMQFLHLNLSEISTKGCIPVSGTAMASALVGPCSGDDSFFVLTKDPLDSDMSTARSQKDAENLFIYRCFQTLPLFRLQSLVAAGQFDEALELCQANDMDETDIYEAELHYTVQQIGVEIHQHRNSVTDVPYKFCEVHNTNDIFLKD